MATKKDLQKELNKFFEHAKGGLKKFGKDVSVLAKKSEKEIVKASKAGKIQLDIVGLNMQKEKLYYDLGKKVVALNAKKSLKASVLEPYFKKLSKLESNARTKKKELSSVGKSKK